MDGDGICASHDVKTAQRRSVLPAGGDPCDDGPSTVGAMHAADCTCGWRQLHACTLSRCSRVSHQRRRCRSSLRTALPTSTNSGLSGTTTDPNLPEPRPSDAAVQKLDSASSLEGKSYSALPSDSPSMRARTTCPAPSKFSDGMAITLQPCSASHHQLRVRTTASDHPGRPPSLAGCRTVEAQRRTRILLGRPGDRQPAGSGLPAMTRS